MIFQGIWHLKLRLVAGKGGDGVISWERNRYNSRMGPSGGDGGNGGSIIFQVDTRFSDLKHINRQSWKASNGTNGQKSNKYGKSASDLIIKVPKETELYDLEKKMKLANLTKNGESYLICKGGRGGRGNKSFRNAQLQSPFLYELGEEGENKEILLKLSSSSLIAVINFSNIEKFNQSLLFNKKIELLPLSTPDLKKIPEAINFCKACIILLDTNHSDQLNNFNLIENFLTKFQKLRILTILSSQDDALSKEKTILSRYGDVISLQSEEFEPKCLTEKIVTFSSSILSVLPLLSPSSLKDDEYVEYSDELFPHKEELKISKTDNGWEVNSQSISYWGSRIPQTTIHNIERLKLKLKVEDIMKQLKKVGGLKGEKLKVGVFETEIY